MSTERTSGILLTILVLLAVHHGLALECYVCSSLEDSSCSSYLKDIEPKTCSSSTSTVTATTVVWSSSTETSVSTTVTQVGESSSSQSTAFTTESSTSISTQTASDSTESGMTTDTPDYSETSSSTTTNNSDSSGTEQSSTEDTGSTSDSTTSANTESDSISIDESMDLNAIDNSLQRSDPDVRLLHTVVRRDISSMISPRNNEDYVCYKIMYTKNGTSVTERGCYAGTSSTICSALNENISPETWDTCTTCKEDGCNSTSTIRLSVTTLLLLLATVFVLIR